MPARSSRKIHLLETVWPDSFVEDTGLTRNISVIRQALGEDERFIATVARVGYRFIEPVTVLESVRESRVAPTAIVGRGDRQLPLVGRADELAALRRAFDEAVRGPGRMIAVTGEPGIGKTTLVDSFLQEIKGAARIGRGRCSERLAGAEPHLPVLEALDEWTGGDPRDVAGARPHGAYLAASHLAEVVFTRAAIAETAEQDSARTSERLMRELTMFLEEASRERPLVLIVEDLHWTDVSSGRRASASRHKAVAPSVAHRHHLSALRARAARSSVHAGAGGPDCARTDGGAGGKPPHARGSSRVRARGLRRRHDAVRPAGFRIPENRRQPAVHGRSRPLSSEAGRVRPRNPPPCSTCQTRCER